MCHISLLRSLVRYRATHSINIPRLWRSGIRDFANSIGMLDTEVGLEKLEPWREHTSAKFSLFMMPGDHFFLYTSRLPLLKAIYEGLAQTAGGAIPH